MVGRSQAKLDSVKAQIAEEVPAAKGVPTMTADTADLVALGKVAASCKVLLSTVGPYNKYGDLVVEACLNEGTHYCDITGTLAQTL